MGSNDDNEIKPEDVVQLNSGGTDITLTGIGSENGQRGALGSMEQAGECRFSSDFVETGAPKVRGLPHLLS